MTSNQHEPDDSGQEPVFSLSPAPKTHRPARFESQPAAHQRPLFAGLDCLPGQQDLFQTDGEE